MVGIDRELNINYIYTVGGEFCLKMVEWNSDGLRGKIWRYFFVE
jgi:hypothetical protein